MIAARSGGFAVGREAASCAKALEEAPLWLAEADLVSPEFCGTSEGMAPVEK
jgi:hypothetical protein